MKKTLALLALVALIALSGCNSEKKDDKNSTTTDGNSASETTTTPKGEEVVFSAGEVEKVSDEALDILGENVPLYRKYLEKRMAVPLILEYSLMTDAGEAKRTLYIRSDGSVSTSSKNTDGTESTLIYSLGGSYLLDPATKLALQFNYKDNVINDYMQAFRYTIKLKDVEAITTYESGETEYEGVLYDRESIVDNDGRIDYYFDKNTKELVYTVTDKVVTKITRIEAAEPDAKYFEVPEGYEIRDFSEYEASLTTSDQQ